MRIRLPLYPILAVLAALSLSGCDSGGSSKQAQIRLLNVSPGYTSLDLYANGEDDATDQQRIAAVAYDAISSYTEIESGTYNVKFKRAGVSSTLQTLSGNQLADDSHNTFIAFGSTGHFAAMQVNDDVTAPDSGRVKVQLLNAAEAGTVDIYLTESSVSLDDATPVFTGVTAGGTGAQTTIDSGDYRLRVTGASDSDDMRLDVPNITLDSTQVVTLILTATQGGVLVDVVLLPQQGSITKFANTKARVRGAVGIANGTQVTLRVGDASLLNNNAVGVVGAYAQVDAGSAAVALGVNGVGVTVPNQTLTAGGEYTLLVWSNADGTQTTLISDDNRLPSSTAKAKVRIINGLSALDVPVTLFVNFFPELENIPLGQASAFAEVDDGTDYQLDVSNADTADPLLTKTEVTLLASGVYTLFMSSSGGTVSGTLRKDR
ncbi:MAG TPA: DUF4397 domain-containing protein [Steroidobacteraceae bacterium]|jgi:hypothetical protein|nr:DUF4397 domain-containing protein [Steroidobacteraceae bacterium]HJY42931.1 DUF4397 domain-containing protein [Steroidobacteraceae bacterium]